MQKGTVFRGFKEHLITFKPTYKYITAMGNIAILLVLLFCQNHNHIHHKFWLPYIKTLPPHLRYDPGTDNFDTSSKQRIPSYTDRSPLILTGHNSMVQLHKYHHSVACMLYTCCIQIKNDAFCRILFKHSSSSPVRPLHYDSVQGELNCRLVLSLFDP